MSPHHTLLGTILVLAALPAADVFAATRSRFPGAHATAFCQPALPAFDGLIRKRPLALQNEGTTTAFVTCSLPVDNTTPDLNGAAIHYVNNTGGEVAIACTLVNGLQSDVTYFVQTAISSAQYFVNYWTSAGSELLADQMSFSCALPPGTGIHFLLSDYTVDVGE
jgi:hypothetical protein